MRGKLVETTGLIGVALSFNEARAFCAGNSEHVVARGAGYGASMRPARFAREIVETGPRKVDRAGLQ